MVSKKGPITELSVGTEDTTPIPTASSPQESPEAVPGSESNSPSLASTTTHSDDEDIPNDVSLKEDENQNVKGRKRAPVKETRTRKKGQKFQCTGYGDCNLCFTRSEHLSRHIRKHTGEKPYKCFCNRDFSRLDNLRQHAFTVHSLNEIPPDWEHGVKSQKTSKNTEGRRKEVYERRARKRQTRVKNPTVPANSPSSGLQVPDSHPRNLGSVSQSQAQHNSYHEYTQVPLPQRQASGNYPHGPVHPQHISAQSPPAIVLHEQTHIHHQRIPTRQQQVCVHQQPVVPHTASSLQQTPLHQQPPLHHQQLPTHRQTPVQHQQGPSIQAQSYHPHAPQLPLRARPQSLILPSQAHSQENAFQGYRQTTPPHSPQSTPQTPRGTYTHPTESILNTPTSTSYHHHRNSISSGVQTPTGDWNDADRKPALTYGATSDYKSVHSPNLRVLGPRKDAVEAEENRRKRMTWHGGEDVEIGGIISPMEHTHLEDPRPPRRPRASTYMPAAPKNLNLPSLVSLLHSPASTPRTLPVASPRIQERRPSSGRFEHSRSRSASHIQHNPETFQPAPRPLYQDNLVERLADARGQRRQPLNIGTNSFGCPEGPSQDANVIFKRDTLVFKHSRGDSSESLAPPRPMEPPLGSARPEFAPEKAKDPGFTFGDAQPTTLNVPTARPRSRTTATTNGDNMTRFIFPQRQPEKMDIFEPQVLGHRSRGSLDFLAKICDQRMEEEKPRLNRIDN